MVEPVTDDQVLAMRTAGRSYGAIAKSLGLGRARDAQEAFQRALRRQPPDAQAEVREAELRRLNHLATRLQDKAGITEDELARKLRAVTRLREMTLAS